IDLALGSSAARGQAPIEHVAGPVGEAHILPAFGRVVATPAVLAANVLGRLERPHCADHDGFAHELHANACAPAGAPLRREGAHGAMREGARAES
ncbi:MotA/TolQ/ExbB proton channel family protein, partial [Paraburkholderia sp. BR14261]